MAKFFHVRDNRDRVRFLLWAGTPWEGPADERFRKSCPSVAQWRWHLILQVLCYLLPGQSVLQGTWDEARYRDGTTFKEGMLEDASADMSADNIGLVTQAIRSEWFWGYGKMLWHANDGVEQCSEWLTLCPCHPRMACQHESRYDKIKRYRDEYGFEEGCPCAGMFAPHLAAGELHERLPSCLNVYMESEASHIS